VVRHGQVTVLAAKSVTRQTEARGTGVIQENLWPAEDFIRDDSRAVSQRS